MLKAIYYMGDPWDINSLNKFIENILEKYEIESKFVNFLEWRDGGGKALYILFFIKEKGGV